MDYAQLVKVYGQDIRVCGTAKCSGLTKTSVLRYPDMDRVSSAIAERHNVTMRMCMRRFTRSTNAFSKKVEIHCAGVALYFFYYNFVIIHKSLNVTPAMEAPVTDRLWDLEDLLELI